MSSGSLKACLHPGEEGRKGRGYQECRKTITSSADRALSPWLVTPQEVFSSAPRIRRATITRSRENVIIVV